MEIVQRYFQIDLNLRAYECSIWYSVGCHQSRHLHHRVAARTNHKCLLLPLQTLVHLWFENHTVTIISDSRRELNLKPNPRVVSWCACNGMEDRRRTANNERIATQ
jgi:hypothetical protein